MFVLSVESAESFESEESVESLLALRRRKGMEGSRYIGKRVREEDRMNMLRIEGGGGGLFGEVRCL